MTIVEFQNWVGCDFNLVPPGTFSDVEQIVVPPEQFVAAFESGALGRNSAS